MWAALPALFNCPDDRPIVLQAARVWLGVAAGSMLQSSILLTIMSRWDWEDKAREVVKAIKAGQAPLAGGH